MTSFLIQTMLTHLTNSLEYTYSSPSAYTSLVGPTLDAASLNTKENISVSNSFFILDHSPCFRDIQGSQVDTTLFIQGSGG